MNIDDLSEWRKKRLAELVARKFSSNVALGQALGHQSGATVGQWLSGHRRLREDSVAKIEALPGLAGWFNLPADMRAPEPSNVAEAPALATSRLVPVVGHVKGGVDGYLEEMQYPVGHGEGFVEYWTKDPQAYALRVKGDSMHPRYRAREFICVTPSIEAQPGQDVVVKLRDGRKLLKQLNWIRDDEIQLLSINDGYEPTTLQLNEVESVQRVAGGVPADAFQEARTR